MSGSRGRKTPRHEVEGEAARPGSRGDAGGLVPDLLRKLLGAGLSGFFTTEEVLRKALGDSVPKEWVEFAVGQSERARRELVDRVAAEVARALDGLDVPSLAERLLQGHALEVTARIHFVPRDGAPDEPGRARGGGRPANRLRVAIARDEGKA